MGLRGVNGAIRPEEAPYPTGTPQELEMMGKDLAIVHSCAVGTATGVKGATIRGCMYADRCHRLFGGKNPKIGSFGPKSLRPDTPGEGPEYIPYRIETIDGDEKEDFMACHRFFATVYARMLASRDPDEPTGEKIKLLGKAGETKILVYETLPEDPKVCNRNNNMTMVTNAIVQIVPKHERPTESDPRWRERLARDEAELVLSDDLMGTSRSADLPDDFGDPEEIEDEPIESDDTTDR